MKPLIIANWKMRMTIVKCIQFVQKFREYVQISHADIVLCAPFTALSALRYELQKGKGNITGNILHPLLLGAQDMYYEETGAFTGEISPAMVKEVAEYVLVGHSERRMLFHENDADVHKKICAAHAVGLIPIVCFGAFVGEKQATVSSFVEKALENQMRNCLTGVFLDNKKKMVIAYEPLEAVGSGNAADPQRISHIFHFMRRFLQQYFGVAAQDIPLIYGGSVTSKNAGSFLHQKEINGLLVGTASVDAHEFSRIVHLA